MGHVIGTDTTYTGNPVSFNAVNGGKMKSISVPFSYTQDLHGYANPWPAGGGKNILPDISRNSSGYDVSVSFVGNTATLTGLANSSGGRNVFRSEYFSLAAGTYYFKKFNESTVKPTVYLQNGTSIVSADANGMFTLSADSTQMNIGINVTSGTDYNYTGTFLISRENVAEYSPYSNICPISGLTGLSVYVSPTQDPDDATVYNVDWTTQAGTVYGGTVDVVTGQLTVTHAGIEYDGSSDEPWAVYSLPRFSINRADFTAPANSVVADIKTNRLQVIAKSSMGNTNYRFSASDSGSHQFMIRIDSSVNTVALLRTWLSNNPLQVVYKLATPLTYQLTPKTINALVGQNYIWSSNSQTLSVVLTAPATGFAGWLIKCVTNGTPVEIPLKYMRAETYTVTPDQRMEWSAERDVTGVLHRETVQNLPPKIEFNTPLMTNSDINALNNIIKAAFTNYLQRNITIQFYDPERNQYWEWDCYMPDVKYNIRNADTANNIINYEELRYAFIGY